MGPGGGVAARVARWHRTEQWVQQQQLAELLAGWFQPWSQAPVEVGVPLSDFDLVADVCIAYPMGWRLVHQIVPAIGSVADLAAQTRRLAAAGIDVIWWLGPEANTPAAQEWCIAHLGWRGAVHPAAAAPFQLLESARGCEIPVDAADPDNAYMRAWRHLALVRYLELWQRIRPADFLRGLAGTAQLGRSVAGIIGAANVRGTLQKRGDYWYPATLTPFYPYRARPWLPAAVASGRDRARQRVATGAPARGA
jgi:hypothetical protein